MDNNLTHNQRTLLLEAARRWLKAVQADKKKNITDAWTGLGFRSEYKCVSDAGLMEDATNCPPMTQTWWKLTERGAQIVQSWIDKGLKLEHFVGYNLSIEGSDILEQN